MSTDAPYRGHTPRVGVFGAGAIGAYLGIRLANAGYPVTLLGRQRLLDSASADQLTAVALDGSIQRPGPELSVTIDAADLAPCDVCLVSVKCGDTQAAGAALADILRPDALVISLQNGLGNIERLRRGGLTRQRALAGVVSFNVRRQDARFTKATDGPLLVEQPGDSWADALRRMFASADEPFSLRTDLIAVQANKLLLNLNNGLCALSGASVSESLHSSDLRWSYAMCMREGVRIMRATGLPVVRVGRIFPPLVVRMLRLPDFVIKPLIPMFKRVDGDARSSTLQDLDAGKKTEIDFLNGEIVKLARSVGQSAPANGFVVEGVHALEEQQPPQFLTPAAVRAGIAAARAGARR